MTARPDTAGASTFVIGTAGHIDHGKTTLVRALTGMDTDRLKVEKERGVTTELGFAHMDIGDGRTVSIVDAPGHERFVRHMIAGAGGLDMAVLVVAADEGVMAQTREHLDILGLVGVKNGMVVLTKCDLVDPDGLELALDDLKAGLSGTFLEGAPVLQFSATRKGDFGSFRKTFTGHLASAFPKTPERPLDRPLRIAVDRVFVMKGFGTVATGTCTAGTLSVGETVSVVPNGPRAVVRGLQSNGVSVESVCAGERAAVNLQGVDREQVGRGQVISTPGSVRASKVLDARFRLLPQAKRPLSRRTYSVFHVGTAQVDGTLFLLDRDELAPSESCLCQIRLSRPVATLAGDPFIVRGFESLANYGKTIGGGSILLPDSRPRGGGDREAIAMLRDLDSGDDRKAVRSAVDLSGIRGIGAAELPSVCRAGRKAVNAALGWLKSSGAVLYVRMSSGSVYVGESTAARLGERAIAALESIHERRPDEDTASTEQIAGALPDRPPIEVLEAVLKKMAQKGLIAGENGRYRHPNHVSSLDGTDPGLVASVLDLYLGKGLSTPSTAEAASLLGMRPDEVGMAVDALVKRGDLVRTGSSGLLFAATVVDDMITKVSKAIKERGSISIADLKKVLGVSRKYAIPLAEYMDSRRVTLRLPDGSRKLRTA